MNVSTKLDASKLLGYNLLAACEERTGTTASPSAVSSAKLGFKPGQKIGFKVGRKIGVKFGVKFGIKPSL